MSCEELVGIIARMTPYGDNNIEDTAEDAENCVNRLIYEARGVLGLEQEPTVPCGLCEGRGKRFVRWTNGGSLQVCCDCNGSGRRTLTDAEKRVSCYERDEDSEI